VTLPTKAKPSEWGGRKRRVCLTEGGRAAEGRNFGKLGFFVLIGILPKRLQTFHRLNDTGKGVGKRGESAISWSKGFIK